MILKVEQISKKMYEADFEIRQENRVIGKIGLQGRAGCMEADVRVEIFSREYALSREGSPHAPAKEKRRQDKKEKAYRTYFIDQGKTGRVCQVERKTGLFSSASFHEMMFENELFHMYSKSFQTEGKNSVYLQDEQIAQVDAPLEIVDDMHRYTVYAINQKGAEIAVLYCAYMYTVAGFKPGCEITKGYYKQASISFDKTFEDKYNPDFVRNIY